jgi:hypothetical protein
MGVFRSMMFIYLFSNQISRSFAICQCSTSNMRLCIVIVGFHGWSDYTVWGKWHCRLGRNQRHISNYMIILHCLHKYSKHSAIHMHHHMTFLTTLLHYVLLRRYIRYITLLFPPVSWCIYHFHISSNYKTSTPISGKPTALICTARMK